MCKEREEMMQGDRISVGGSEQRMRDLQREKIGPQICLFTRQLGTPGCELHKSWTGFTYGEGDARVVGYEHHGACWTDLGS